MIIDQNVLKTYLKYFPETGDFMWLGNARKDKKFTEAGCVTEQGYIKITIKRKGYKAHRLAWLYVYGYLPNGPIDHINNVRIDNRICNLRVVSTQDNVRNSVVRKAKKSGLLKGVTYYKQKSDKFVAQIRFEGRQRKLGVFDSELEAHTIYCQEAKKHFGEFANFGYGLHGEPNLVLQAI
tara:strand:- start:91 stop:630 length:540 start_codon:yes stop_codon:yes gene_type:complete